MRAFGAAIVFFALSACSQVQTTGYNGTGTSGGRGTGAGTAGGQASTGGTSGGPTSGGLTSSGTSSGANPCATRPPCPAGLVCDPARGGACECYLGGPACGPTQTCDLDGGCVDDPCFGVTCTASGAQCFGGICRCGGAEGVECSAPGESCSPIDNSCRPASSCAITPCSDPGFVCNPDDSTCHCGSTDGPVCVMHQKCGDDCLLYFVDGGPLAPGQDAGGAAVYGECNLGSPCRCVTCQPFEACDVNNNGACECGGDPAENKPGVVCAANQVCVDFFDGGIPACAPSCDPFGAECPTGPGGAAQGCYPFPISAVMVCAVPTGDAGFGGSCQIPTDCAIPFACEPTFVDGGTGFGPPACVALCNPRDDGGVTTPDSGVFLCRLGSFCTPLWAGAPAGLCLPQ